MRHVNTVPFAAFVTALVAFTAGTAQGQNGQIIIKMDNGQTMTMQAGANGQVVLTPSSSSDADAPAPAPLSPAAELTKILAGVGLTQAQKDSVAKLDKVRDQAVADYDAHRPKKEASAQSDKAREQAMVDIDARHLAAVRALLTAEQRTKVDQRLEFNKAIDKKQAEAGQSKQ